MFVFDVEMSNCTLRQRQVIGAWRFGESPQKQVSFILQIFSTVRNITTGLIAWLSFRRIYKKLRGFNSPANYTDRTTASCRRSQCQL
jgi:hypothetical protein